MLQIRNGVFETNSSSSHSIVIMKEGTKLPDVVDADWRTGDDGIISFYESDLEFGRAPFDLLTDWCGRLRYAIADTDGEEDSLEQLREICRRRIMNFVDFDFEVSRWSGNPQTGYIDHQSKGVLSGALTKYKATLEDFIFDDRYIVVIDGDEYNVFDRFTESGMFNAKNVKDVYP